MARAPRPGVSRREEERDESQQMVTITIKRDLVTGKDKRIIPQSYDIAIGNVPMRERIICRKATGLPLTAFWAEDRIDIDSVMVLWWMARRLNGEATLTFDQAAADWPEDLDLESELDLEMDDGEDSEDAEDDSPEG